MRGRQVFFETLLAHGVERIFGNPGTTESPLLDSLLFSLAIAVGITPQRLPAVVSTSLATGSRRLAHDCVPASERRTVLWRNLLST